ncbi:Uncharacterised protein [Legionella wadsworthii]|uniref:Neurogenic locus notch like protein n=1 Tax=Legionella wadsworthii TaxID=28088 RepID=A0A378LSP9_9GAMM|nr:hypothetical protein [Legionella wadsworthii]STY29764.1 Uncharacterised protein [Legionella wadsworthii]
MKNDNLASKWTINLIAILFLLGTPLAGAYAACCSGHGGVASCNKTTGFKMCKDGTASPTCTCKIEKVKKTTTKSTVTPASESTTTTKKSKSGWWGGKTTTTTPSKTIKSTTTKTTSAKGCCSKHGGVAQCDKSTGHLKCKDGSQSPTCGCQ